MIPILYESTETEFTSNGLGRLSDAISCIVEEERNGAYELTMEYPIHGVHYKDLQNMRVISAVPSDGKERQPFDIYDISRPISGKVTVKARHISYRLSRIPTYSKNPDETSGTAALALQRLKSEALESCPFEFWTDQDSQGSYSTPAPASIRSRLGGVTGSILDCFGGEYEWDGWTVKLWKARGSETSVVLRYGKNITDITQEESIENTVTGVLPYWHKDAESDTAAQTVVGSIVYAENADKYPYHMTMVLDCSQDFQTAPTTGQLAAKAQTYIKANNIGVPDVSITLSFVALWQSEEYKALAVLERVHLCDTLRVEFPALGVSATAKVVKTTYNALKDRYDSIEIGNARTNLADQITGTSRDTEIRQKQSLSFLQEALARSTKLIQGGLGGHVIINTDGDGKPNELLIMDTDDTKTASKVLRINMNGIGFSTKGYEGPFSTAWTIDGVFNADFINAGTIRANLIRTGTLKVGGTEKVDQMLLYDSYNKQSGYIGSEGIYVTGKWINTDKDPDVYIEMRAQLIGGMAISAAADRKGKCCAFSEDEILVKNNDSTLSWGLGSNTTSMRYNGLWINGPNGVNDILIYLDAEWGLGVKSGLNKSGIVETKNYGTRALYCYEMASPTYGDIGEGEIGEDGSEYIQIDPVLSECILTDQYQVFLQPYGNGKCYIAERKSTYFVVSGEPGLKFGWEIKAKNRDYNMNRLSVFDYTRPEKDETDYAGKAVNHIEQITKERRQT